MEETNTIKKGLNSNQLKIIAIIAMTIDHVTQIILSSEISNSTYFLLRFIGKITIPIMWFFISEGYFHTRNIKKYIGRLFIFSIISHFAFCYALDCPIIPTSIFIKTSVIWSLLWGLIALCIAKSDKLKIWAKTLLIFAISCLTYNADWGLISIVAIVILGISRDNRKIQMVGMAIVVMIYELLKFSQSHNYYQFMHFGIYLSIPFLLIYNGQKGNCKWLKWFFYIYYPLHLFILGIISNLL